MNITIILLILLVGIVVTFLSGNRLASKVAMLFSVATAVFSIALLTQFLSGGTISYSTPWISNPSVLFSLQADGLGMAMLLLTTLLTPVIIYTKIAYPVKKEKVLYSLILFMELAMIGTFLSSDGLVYYIFWELSLIPIYFIILYWGNGDLEKRKKATLTFFIYTFAGSLFMLAAFIYLYQITGSLSLDALYSATLTAKEQTWIFLAFFLAFAIKSPIFPFHTWQANAYQKAPAVGTMLLAALMSKMGLYSIIRWQLPITPLATAELQYIVIALCLAGVVYGSLIALRQDNIKRLLAYSSLAHVGLIAAGIYSLTTDGLQGAVYQMMAHGIVIVGLFFAADIIFRRTQIAMISELGGIKSLAPRFTIAFITIVFASIALPPMFTFVGEFSILYGLFQLNGWLALLGGTTLFLGAFYMLRMYQKVMLGPLPSQRVSFTDIHLHEIIIMAIIILALIGFGIYSKPVTELIAPSIQEILTYVKR